jgi:drug/metabolite transporter (DMT)-like permease
MTRVERPGQAIALLIAATACFVALDTTAKFISASVPLVMAIWTRNVFQVFVTSAVLLPRRGRTLLVTRHPVLQFMRGAMLLASSCLAFLSLRYMPIGEFTAIVMLTPLVITAMAAFSLGEQVPPLRWVLVLGGFCGALIVIRPGAEDFNWTLLLPLALVGTSTAFQLLTSRLAAVEDAGTMHFYTGCVGTLLTTLALPFTWQTPAGVRIWTMLLFLGICSSLGHFLLILAYGRASAATLTPYLYFQIAFATLSGWLVFKHAPDAWAVTGIAVIAVCGVLGTWLHAGQARR